MERLTFDGNFCDIAQCTNTPGGSFCEDGFCSQRKVWERLKEYENTGLGPKQVRTLQQDITSYIMTIDEYRALNATKEIGKTVFLTCQEAEAALCYEERNGHNDENKA